MSSSSSWLLNRAVRNVRMKTVLSLKEWNLSWLIQFERKSLFSCVMGRCRRILDNDGGCTFWLCSCHCLLINRKYFIISSVIRKTNYIPVLLSEDELYFFSWIGSIELIHIDQTLTGLQILHQNIKQFVRGKIYHVKTREKVEKPCSEIILLLKFYTLGCGKGSKFTKEGKHCLKGFKTFSSYNSLNFVYLIWRNT